MVKMYACYLGAILFLLSCNENLVNNVQPFFNKNFVELWQKSLLESIDEQIVSNPNSKDSIYLKGLHNQKKRLENSFLNINAGEVKYKDPRYEIYKKLIDDLRAGDTINCSRIYLIDEVRSGEKVQYNICFLIVQNNHLSFKNYHLEYNGWVLLDEGICKKTTAKEISNYFKEVHSNPSCEDKDYANLDFYSITEIKNNIIKSKIIYYLCGSSVLLIE